MIFYAILGVTPGASPSEIKRAYRRLAMLWHPDRNPHPDATERFKEIRAAYDALLALDGLGNSPEGNETGDATPGSPVPPRAEDIRLELEITLHEAWSGCQKTVRYQRSTLCQTCAGSGEHGITRTRFCTVCHGSGRVRGNHSGLLSCAECAGRGFFSERICMDCAGTGRLITEVGLQIKVPAGMLPGDELRLSGQGESGTADVLPGDLFLTVRMAKHPLFHLDGRDLYLVMPINALTLIAGGEIAIPLPGGESLVQLAPGTAEVRELRLAGKGYPGRGSAKAGDCCVTLKPILPQTLDASQRNIMRQLIDTFAADGHQGFPEISAWWRELKAADSAGN